MSGPVADIGRAGAIGRWVSTIILGLATLLATLVLSPGSATQPPKVARIGVLFPGSPADLAHRLGIVRDGLRELGWIEGQNLAFEVRSAEGRPDRLPELAAELVRLKPDVIVTSGGGVVRALQ